MRTAKIGPDLRLSPHFPVKLINYSSRPIIACVQTITKLWLVNQSLISSARRRDRSAREKSGFFLSRNVLFPWPSRGIYKSQPPPQALRFSHGRGERETSDWWWTARDHGKGTDGLARCLLPAFLCAHIEERRLGTRQYKSCDVWWLFSNVQTDSRWRSLISVVAVISLCSIVLTSCEPVKFGDCGKWSVRYSHPVFDFM